mgnify:CR=1 FL=1
MSNESASESIPSLTSETPTTETSSESASLDSAKDAQTPGAIIADAVAAATDEVTLPELSPAQLAKLLSTVKRRVKVNGAELEVGLDELEKDYQLKSASHEKMREAAAARKQVEEYTALLKTDPRKALKLFGVDVRALAESELSAALEDEMLTAEARELRDLKRSVAERDAKDAETKAVGERAEMEAHTLQLQQSYQRDIETTLRGAGLPVTGVTVRSVAAYMQNGIDNNLDLKASDVIDLVKTDYQNQLREFFSAAAPESMAALLGEDGMKKLRAYDLGRLKAPGAPVKLEDQPPATEATKKKGKMSLEQFLAANRKAKGLD